MMADARHEADNKGSEAHWRRQARVWQGSRRSTETKHLGAALLRSSDLPGSNPLLSPCLAASCQPYPAHPLPCLPLPTVLPIPFLLAPTSLTNSPATGHTTAAEPADATPVPATSTETPAESEEIGAKTTDPAPAAPTSTPAPGMSATSGPLDDHPAFETKDEK